MGNSGPDRDEALRKYSTHAKAVYQRASSSSVGEQFAEHRRSYIAKLALKPGETVIDVGCGTGLSFPVLEEGVGAEGRIVGIDQSPDMLRDAHKVIAEREWHNILLINSPVETAEISVQADAALFSYTHDIMRNPKAVANIASYLKPGGRVVSAGIAWAPIWNVRANIGTFREARTFTTTFEGLRKPWSHLEDVLSDLRIEFSTRRSPFGRAGIYIAVGRR